MMSNRARKGAPWSEDEDNEIRRRCAEGEFLEDIARALGRSSEGVRTRANILGVPCKSGRRAQRGRSAIKLVKVAPYRLVCLNSDGSTQRIEDLDAPDEASAVALARNCSAPGGCEVWRTGREPTLIGRS